MINITLPDGSIKQVKSGTTAMDIAMVISEVGTLAAVIKQGRKNQLCI